MIRCCFFLFLGLWFPLVGRADIGAPITDEFVRAQFAAQGLGWSATQLADGRLAFGFDALSIYDGTRWKTHSVPKTYALRALDAATEGGLWVGGVNEIGFLEPRGAGFRYRSLVPQLPPGLQGHLGDVWHAFAEGPGRAVFVSTEYVLRWTGEKFEIYHLPGAPRLAAFRSDGRILIGHRPSGLRALGKTGLENVLSAEQLQGAGVVWSGTVGARRIIATTSGLQVLQNNVLTSFAPSLDNWIRDNVLTCVVRLRDGGIALGTLKGGVTLVNVDGSVIRKLELNEEFPTEAVHALFEDKEGWLWVVSPARLLRVLPSRAVSIFVAPRSAAFPAHAVAPFGDGALVASETGLWRTLDSLGPDAKRFSKLRGLHERMLGLLQDGPNVVVAHRGGVSTVLPNGSVNLIQAFPSDVFALAHDPQGRLLAAIGHRILQLTSGAAVEIPGVLPDVPTSLAALSNGTIVAGTWSRGIASVGNADAGITSLREIVSDQSGPAYVALTDGVLFAVRGKKVAAFDQQKISSLILNLPEDFEPKAIAKRSRFEAWLGGERQFADGVRLPIVYQLRLEPDRLEATPLRLDVLNRVGSLRSLATDETTDGPLLWIGGDSALLRVAPTSLPAWSAPSAPSLRLVSDLPITDGQLVLPYQKNHLEIEIFSPEPGRRPGLRLQTMIDGAGSSWSNPHDQYGVALANLQSGHYQVRARLIAPDGSASPIASFPVIVARPWWFTGWAIASEALLAALLVFGIVRLRLHSLRTRAMHLEKLVAKRTAQLTHASQAKSEFVASMSHELRNPLNGIVASAHALDESGLAAEQRSLLATVRHCAGLLDALIGDVLDLAEIESGTIKLRVREYKPSEVVIAAASVVRPIAERKGLRLAVEIDQEVPGSARGDAFRVQQVILNLLGNAVKFSDRGEIKLSLRTATLESAVPVLEFQVRDEGPGIAPADRERLFEKFSRLASARDKGVPGTGLGLALCRQLVERMGGRIWLETTSGPGSTFSFRVPVQTDLAIDQSGIAAGDFVPPRSALVIEDLDYNAQAMVAILKRMRCRADTATTGAMALEKLQSSPVDVVFLDCDLPDMTGPELAQAIVALQRDQPAQSLLVATTAYADDATRQRCRKAGMGAFIAKPVTPEKIRSALSSVGKSMPSASPPSMPDPSLPASSLDLRQLSLLGDKPAEVREAAQRLREMLKADMTILRNSCQSGDFATTRSTAHRIVSHAKFVGAKPLAMVASEIERSATEEPEAALELLPAAENHAESLMAHLDLPST